MSQESTIEPTTGQARRTGEVFAAFLRLGLTSFGGPTAHLGYFREAFVEKRKWLSDRAYADLVALCQFLPGPASSQVGMALGLHRAGPLGMLAAWLAFTLPSAIVLVIFAFGADALLGQGATGWLDGLKAVAVAVVAQAVFGMAKSLTPDAARATIAVGVVVAVLLLPSALTQIGVIIVSGLIGLFFLRTEATTAGDDALHIRLPKWFGVACLVVFFVLLFGLPALYLATGDSTLRLVDMFYRAGALVFGGGHVVLPLLEAEVVQGGLVGQDAFLAGYGAAQAVPGPLFTFAAYLGAVTNEPPTGVTGAAIALVAIFLPSALLLLGVLPFWEQLRANPKMRRALTGVNAGVVGLLGAALYSPVFTSGVTSIMSFCIALVAWLALAKWKVPAWAVVIGGALLGAILL
ncbi:chromate efflux transporter [Gulosibacter molinativorax]|uniref:Chromate transporter n=1 Tax=Gulosibacter molinativorax TaxID=256821 RepID=A0ABT7CBV4_9MICO|nr:chromate efflux transporter [Gulosibacter molinativorax]MDJ1372680.1 chromate transporter [Gulosibacter molinativorax]QUY60994.1 ChrA [Gulosibacter molinativorax]